jgi:plastocyanin
MKRQRTWVRTSLAAAAAAMMVASVACGGGDGTAKASGTTSGSAAAPAGATVSEIHSVGTDNKFDAVTYTVKAGQPVTLHFENKGQALHNFHIKAQGKDSKEPTTQLFGGGKSETITFQIDKPGTYEFLCDVHPVEMKGKITVVQ